MKHLQTCKLFFIVASIALCLSSCSNDDKTSLSRTDLLTSSKWVFSDAVHVDAGIESVLVAEFTGSEITFHKDGSYDLYEPIIQQNTIGNWEFNNSETSILTDKNTVDEDEVQIMVLNSNNLRIKLIDADFGTFELIFIH